MVMVMVMAGGGGKKKIYGWLRKKEGRAWR
jgi:hypothetical protein